MTTMTAAHRPLPSPAEAQEQLNADLRAVLSSDPTADSPILVGRPSILRRLAAGIAASIGPETDRIIARTGPDAQLATAVSVHTGVAMAVISADGSVSGEIHPGERIVPVSLFAAEAEAHSLAAQIAERAAAVLGHLHAIDLPGDRAKPTSAVTTPGLPGETGEEAR